MNISSDLTNLVNSNQKLPKMFFESPVSWTDFISNDYFYALQACIDNKKYMNIYWTFYNKGLEIIFDNSAYELKEKIPNEETFCDNINKLNPDSHENFYYIVNDYFGDTKRTKDSMRFWLENYADKAKGKIIGVIQGNNLEECLDIYQYYLYEDRVKKIALNNALTTLTRRDLLQVLLDKNLLTAEKPIHLLGCKDNVLEYREYKPFLNYIDSIDTSSPVTQAMENISYGLFGNLKKSNIKIFKHLNDRSPTRFQKICLKHNINFLKSLFI